MTADGGRMSERRETGFADSATDRYAETQMHSCLSSATQTIVGASAVVLRPTRSLGLEGP